MVQALANDWEAGAGLGLPTPHGAPQVMDACAFGYLLIWRYAGII